MAIITQSLGLNTSSADSLAAAPFAALACGPARSRYIAGGFGSGIAAFRRRASGSPGSYTRANRRRLIAAGRMPLVAHHIYVIGRFGRGSGRRRFRDGLRRRGGGGRRLRIRCLQEGDNQKSDHGLISELIETLLQYWVH
jgi:hypothetical protein